MTMETAKNLAASDSDIGDRSGTGQAWLWLALSVAGNSVGNVLMKSAILSGTVGLELLVSLPCLGGVALFGVGVIAYVKALATLPLSVSYPTMVGASIVAITLMALWLFDERFAFWHVVGVALIFSGVLILTRHTKAGSQP